MCTLSDPSTPIVQFISPLAAAFFGSFATYLFGVYRENKKENSNKTQAAQQVLFTLIRQYNVISRIKRDFFTEYKDYPDRHLRILPAIDSDYSDLRINIDSISFLLSTKFRDTLNEILQFESIFHVIIVAITNRSKSHFELQKKCESAGIGKETIITPELIQQIISDRLDIILKKSTDEIYNLLDEWDKSFMPVIEKFRNELIKLFPGHKFIRPEIIKKPKQMS
jgi:hypothetical protein